VTLLSALRAAFSVRAFGSCPTHRPHLIEPLEGRTLLSVFLSQPIGNVSFAQDSGTETANLSAVFFDSNGQQDLAFAATSSNPSVVSASVSGSSATLSPQAGRSGFAVVRLTATAPDGSSASNAFRVQITAAQSRTLHVSLGGARKSFTFAASNQAAATVTLNGPGTADVLMGGDALRLQGSSLLGANQELESITLSGTTAASSLLITGRGASRFTLDIGNISSTDALGTLQAKGVTLVGDVSVTGGLHKLDVDSADTGSIDAGSSPITVQGLSFVDESFTTTGPVRSVTMGQWVDSDASPETFSAASIGRLTVRGSFQPAMQITDALGATKIGGTIGGTWDVGRAPGPISVGGSIGADFNGTFGAMAGLTVRGAFNGTLTAPSLQFLNVGSMREATVNLTAVSTNDLRKLNAGPIAYSSILSAGNIGNVVASQLLNCRFLAGATSLPVTASDFSSAASIASIALHPKSTALLSFDSVVAATSIGSLLLGTTRTNNGGVPYGVAARSIQRFAVFDQTQHRTIILKNVHDPAALGAQIAAQKVALGDLILRIV
jgi:hypothetical protein